MENMNINDFNKSYDKMSEKSSKDANEICDTLLRKCLTEPKNYSIKNCMLTAAFITQNFASMNYKENDSFAEDIIESRKLIIDKIIPAIIDLQPCGECEACLDHDFANCTNFQADEKHSQLKFLLLTASSLVQYAVSQYAVMEYFDEKENKE